MSKTELNEINESLKAACDAQASHILDLEAKEKLLTKRNTELRLQLKRQELIHREAFSRNCEVYFN